MGSPAIFNGSRTKLLTANGLLLQTGMTIDYDGAINYVGNSGFEINSTGYNAYADAAGAVPVDGTGGSPTVTIARSTVTPLMQTASGLFTKTAVNSQGQGFSYDFTIDSGVAAQGLPCTVAAYYKIASGTFVSGDMTVWIYDITNAQVIQPSASSILGATVPQNIQCEFQPNVNSTSYRLIFHVSTVSALAYTVEFDNIRVSPNTYNPGAVVTPWTLYTPTYTGFGTVTTSNMYWRRDGDSLQVQGNFVFGTTTAVNAAIGLPAGLVIDTTQLSSTAATNMFGTAARGSNSTFALASANVGPWVIMDRKDLSTTAVYIGTGSSGNTFGSGAGSSIGASGELLSVQFTVKIAGWGVNQVLSSDTDTRVVSAIITNSGSVTVNTSTMVLNTATKDTHGAYNTSTGVYTVPVPGYYLATITNATLTGAGAEAIGFKQNGGTLINVFTFSGTATVGGGSTPLFCNAGDLLTVTGSGTGSSLVAGALVSYTRVSGPAQIAASESINARYYASATSISGSLATIVWTTKDFDSHNAMASGVYTVPAPGKYQINTNVQILGTIALNSSVDLQVQKNGAAVSEFQTYAGGAMTAQNGQVSDTISCLAGDTIRVQLSSSATLPTIAASNTKVFFSIERVGN